MKTEIKVKWKGFTSTFRNLNGGSLGIEEYLSQSNDNCNILSEEDKFKFIDDLSMLELVNLISVGIASYNFKAHVASDIRIDNYYLPVENILSRKTLLNSGQNRSK